MWENICRVCSSGAEYDIFSVIPAYLHASSNEFLHWKKQINQLLEDVTGLVISQNDGLPQKMCALCISYLKHAATFRQQAIDNTLNLKAAIAVTNPRQSKDELNDKENTLITMNDLIFSEKRKTETKSLINNMLNNQAAGGVRKADDYLKKLLLLDKNEKNNLMKREDDDAEQTERSDALKTYLNLLFDKDTNAGRSTRQTKPIRAEGKEEEYLTSDMIGDEFQTASSDDNEACEQKKNFFSYKEKNFEEDDVMDLEELKDANIIVNVPELCKERKCRACFRRFMFEDSFKEHMEVCIEYKFLLLIEEINRLLDIRRSKAVSPHEFIRRMIFSLKKTCQWLSANCGETLLPEMMMNGDGKKRLESECKSSGAEVSSGGKSDENFNPPESGHKKLHDNPLLDILKQKADPTMRRYMNATPDPLLQRLKSMDNLFTTSTPELDTSILCHKFEESMTIKKTLNETSDEVRISAALGLLNKRYTPLADMQAGFKRIQTSSEEEEELAKAKQLLQKNPPPPQVPQYKPTSASKQKHLLFQKAQILPVNTNSPFAPTYPKISFSARCGVCDITFVTIGSLEEHNAKFHNNRSKLEEHKKIIALFEDDDDEPNAV